MASHKTNIPHLHLVTMAIHKIPQITKEDVAGIYRQIADKEKNPQTS